MNEVDRHYLYGWLRLLALIAIEYAASTLPIPSNLRPVLMLPALTMIAVVGLVFTRVTAGPSIARIFAIASLVWLLILLGLGMMGSAHPRHLSSGLTSLGGVAARQTRTPHRATGWPELCAQSNRRRGSTH
ncbi:MAG TPA: hypothetical protein VMB34_08530 [Acetobacteraceae bacterium]|nr:hypothetical protein [Acetobacteraceae bacterium]